MKLKNTGATLFVNHESGSTISVASLSNSQGQGGDLTFDPLTTANLRLYYDLGRRANGRRVPSGSWRQGLRVTLDVENIANARPSVSNADGNTPFGYEDDELDPLGRTVKISLRKVFSTRPSRQRRN